MKWLSLQCWYDFGVDEVDRQATRPRTTMDLFLPLPDELETVSDTSNTRSVMNELCMKPTVNVVRICLAFKEKLNGRSLLALHPAAKNLNAQRC
jgi:hypothetical protein